MTILRNAVNAHQKILKDQMIADLREQGVSENQNGKSMYDMDYYEVLSLATTTRIRNEGE